MTILSFNTITVWEGDEVVHTINADARQRSIMTEDQFAQMVWELVNQYKGVSQVVGSFMMDRVVVDHRPDKSWRARWIAYNRETASNLDFGTKYYKSLRAAVIWAAKKYYILGE